MSRAVVIGFALFVTLALVVSPAAQSQTLTQGQPEFRVVGPEYGVHPGQTVDITFQLQNEAKLRTGSANPTAIERVTTARGVRVTVDEGRAPVTVKSGTIGLGNVPEGQTPVTVRIAVDADADPGTYDLPVEIRFRYTSLISERSGIHQEVSRTRTTDLTLEILEGSRFRIVNTQGDIRVGERGTVNLELENVGEHDARDATVHLTTPGTDLSFLEGPESVTAVGTWAVGERKSIPVDVRVARETSVRGLAIDAIVHYRDLDGAVTESPVVHTAVTPRPSPTFELVDVRSATQIGATGPVELVLRNTGTETVRGASVGADVTSEVMRIDGSFSSESFVGDWEPGQDRTATFDLGVADDTTSRTFGIAVDVRYDGVGGERIRSDRLTTSVTPAPEQTFAFHDVESTLRIDATGRIHGTVENTGELSVRDLRLAIPEEHPSIGSVTGPAVVGTLDPGETRTFTIRGDVDARTDPGAHQLDLDARYRTVGDAFQRSTNTITVEVGDRLDPIAITPTTTEFDAGYRGVLELEVETQLPMVIRDVELRLVVDDPFESDFQTSVVPVLEPGQVERVAFDLEIDANAPASSYPAYVEIEYTDADDERVTVRPTLIGISVLEVDRELVTIEIVILLLLAILVGAAFVWLYRR